MRTRIHYGLLVVGALFGAGLIANQIQGDAHPGDTPIQLAIMALCAGAFFFVQRAQNDREQFFRFLLAERDAIRAGNATYRGYAVTYATQVHTPHIVLGFLIVSFKLALRPILSTENARGYKAGAIATTMLFGWWGIRAFIWNLGTIANNVRGKPVTTVGELIEGSPIVSVPAARAS